MKERIYMKTIVKLGIAALIATGICGAAVIYASGTIQQKSVLEGPVISVVPAGTKVREGDVLVTVDSLAGPVPAARAEADGVVKEVLVEKGQKLNKQEPVAVVESR